MSQPGDEILIKLAQGLLECTVNQSTEENSPFK